jgi:hypothetical protein
MFFEVLLRHLKSPTKYLGGRPEDKWKKPHTAATRYINLYAASSMADTHGKDPSKINMVLDRRLMWNSPKVPGCQSAYCFRFGNFNTRADDETINVSNLMVTPYPCPSQRCACASSHLTQHTEFGELPPCENVALMGPTHRLLRRAVLINKTVGEEAGLANPNAEDEEDIGDTPLVITNIADGPTSIRDRVVDYLQNMFNSTDNFVFPLNQAE